MQKKKLLTAIALLGIFAISNTSNLQINAVDSSSIKNYTVSNNNKDVTWDGTIDTSWYNENDMEFNISTPQQLAGLADLVNKGNNFSGKTISLIKDVYLNDDRIYSISLATNTYDTKEKILNWIPIGISKETAFSGTFQGNNHYIYNINVSEIADAGFFGNITDAVIKNLRIRNLDSSYILQAKNNIGSFCAVAYKSTFENCTSRVTIKEETGENDISVGAIAGTANNCTFKCCMDQESIAIKNLKGNVSLGGISGISTKSRFEDCIGSSLIIAKTDSGKSYAGGICGYGAEQITRCKNYAPCFAVSTNEIAYSGGITAVGMYDSNETEIESCANEGFIIISKSDSGFDGGICGYGGKITNCYNKGYVTAVKGTPKTYIGGIAASTATINNCYNYGAVNSKINENDNMSQNIAGGIIADLDGKALKSSYYLIYSPTEDTVQNSIGGAKEPDYKAAITENDYFNSKEFAELMGDAFFFKADNQPCLKNVDQTFKGDINSDGIIDFYDLQEARNIYSNGFKTLSQFCAADIDDNKIIDSDDVNCVNEYIIGKSKAVQVSKNSSSYYECSCNEIS
ncbi:MAG: hypothetical protein LKG21_08565 [Ruminococcus sp.]|jgi:hypothetical protein|nr:hypothetical protein [Ruminococcus sp.]